MIRVEAHFSEEFSTMLVYANASQAKIIRKILGMIDKNSSYYDPAGKEDGEKPFSTTKQKRNRFKQLS